MRTIIGPNLLSSKVAEPTKKPFELYDSRLPGFTLRVQPSGVRSYYARFGRNRRIALGKADDLLPDEAQKRCQKVLGNVAHGRHPLHGLGGTDGITLGKFIADTYTTWVKASRPRTAADTLEKLYRHFRTWYPEPLTAITVERVEAWKTWSSETQLYGGGLRAIPRASRSPSEGAGRFPGRLRFSSPGPFSYWPGMGSARIATVQICCWG